ncbi:MAG TPA: DNA polymerase/3'-5' exonuclease PolX [Myxococcales bacterium]|nr:DNA polymerase/3'-5' exonuclease PolX [Myxococcales bacterium]
MENADVARVLSEVADLLDLTGGSVFRSRAYRQAAQVVDLLPVPVSELWRKGELTAQPGIGDRMAEHIAELLKTGVLPEHRRLSARVPPGVLEMLRIEGMGPKSVALAWKDLHVATIAELEAACRDGRFEALPRMGPKRVAAILAAIERLRARGGRTPLYRALPAAEALLARLRAVRGVERAEIAGSLRRHRETIGDIDLLAAAADPAPVMKALTGAPDVAQILGSGPTKSSVKLEGGLQVDLRVLPVESFGAALLYFTGSQAHNIALRTRGVRLGLKLNEYGVFDKHGKRLGGATEEEMYAAIGLPWIPPELREARGELEAAEKGTLPALIEEADVLGDLHVHSKRSSDGRSSLEELAAEAARLGRRYLAITDHSRSRPLGVTAEQLPAQIRAVQAADAAAHGRPHLLTGLEVDILPDGTLDLPNEALAKLDVVVASVHSHFSQPAGEMTERMIRAIRSGVVDVLGHPSGRQLGARDAYEFDLEKVLDAAREAGVALEVNAMPERLDLTDTGCRLAKSHGVRVAISSDAHLASQLGNLRYGVWTARRGWLEKGDVLNALPLQKLERALARA